MVHTNNGVEAQNRAFKYDYLQPFRTKSLSNMLSSLIDGFLVDSYRKYVFFVVLNVGSCIQLICNMQCEQCTESYNDCVCFTAANALLCDIKSINCPLNVTSLLTLTVLFLIVCTVPSDLYYKFMNVDTLCKATPDSDMVAVKAFMHVHHLREDVRVLLCISIQVRDKQKNWSIC